MTAYNDLINFLLSSTEIDEIFYCFNFSLKLSSIGFFKVIKCSVNFYPFSSRVIIYVSLSSFLFIKSSPIIVENFLLEDGGKISYDKTIPL